MLFLGTNVKMFESIENDTADDLDNKRGSQNGLPKNVLSYDAEKTTNRPTEGSGFIDYEERNGTCSECENFCGSSCFPVCSFFQESDCQIPNLALNNSGIIFHIKYTRDIFCKICI